MSKIRSCAVLGAGVMGSGIAAHLAGAGIRVRLLDIVKDPQKRNLIPESAIASALKAKPAPFFDPEAKNLITPGNFEDNLKDLSDVDLVIEAVVENLDIKKSLFAKIAPHLSKTAILASNTSGLSVQAMSDVLPQELQHRFMVMHFFNPVRYMHLLELVPGPKTDPAIMHRVAEFGEMLGKGIVYAKDTPNFIGNRIGIYGLMAVMHLMDKEGYTIEEVDKIVGQPMGRPSSAAFQTADIVGIDTFAHVAKNCYDTLLKDEERDIFQMPAWALNLIKEGRLGRKSGAGFYKKEGAEILVLDLKTGQYRPQEKIRIDSLGKARNIENPGERLKMLVESEDKAGTFAWKVLAKTLIYSALRVGEISDDIVQIDRAMKWGFNWDLGPFEAWDAIGVKTSVERMKKEGLKVPAWVEQMLAKGQETFYGPSKAKPSHYQVAQAKLVEAQADKKQITFLAAKEDRKKIVQDTLGASLVDIGDGVLAVEVHTKMNTIDDDVVKMLNAGVVEAEKNFRALVIANDGQHFGAGANLMLIYMAAQQQEWGQIESAVTALQNALQGLRYAQVPVVAAPFQYTFGGCAEIAMAADACEAHAETYMGLVEVGAGLVPAGGGCLRMVERWTQGLSEIDNIDLLPFVGQGSLNIAMAKVATSAEEAKRLRYLLPSDGISLNRDHLLHNAKARAIGLADAGYRAPRPRVLYAAGIDAAKTINMRAWSLVEGGYASEHDALIAKKVAYILCGGNVPAKTVRTEQNFLDLEREAFLSLCGEEKSQARMQSLLMSGKPLRN